MGEPGLHHHGACMVIPGQGVRPRGDAGSRPCGALHRLYGVPTMFIAELDHPRFGEFDLSSLRTGIMAGSPCPIEVMRQVIERMTGARSRSATA